MRNRYFRTEGFRLSAIYALAFALSVAVIGALILFTTRHALLDEVVGAAQTETTALQRAYTAEGMPEVLEVLEQLKGASGDAKLYLLQKDGRKIAGNMAAMSPRYGVFFLSERGCHRILGVGTELAPGLYAFAGSRLSRVHAVQEQILQMLLWVFLVAFILAATGGVLVSRSFLSRTDAMATACRTIMDGNLSARLPVRGTRDELDRLAGAVNEMLDRIAVLMENLGQVTSDIAHDLRTPVTHLRQRLENGRTETTDPKAEAAFEAAIQKTDELLAMFAALLRIVQIEGGSHQAAFTKVNLAALLKQLYETFIPVAEATEHALLLEADVAINVNGDRALLLQLFSNLIENAIIHTPVGTHIFLRLTSVSPDTAAVTVADDGFGVPAEEHPKLFRRLYRREASRTTPGYGLGLSLVTAIADLHSGKVKIDTVPKGFSVRVVFDAIQG